MPLKFSFKHFYQLKDTELVTVPDSKPFSDGGNPIVRYQVLIEIKPSEFKRVDLVADGEGLYLFKDGCYVLSYESCEGKTLNRVRELDQFNVVPFDVINEYNF